MTRRSPPSGENVAVAKVSQRAGIMPMIYRGIDIAGDQGQTGFVDLVEEDDGRLWARCDEVDLTGTDGLKTLIRIGEGEQLVSAAIDQPLGFPARTLRLLAWPEQVAN